MAESVGELQTRLAEIRKARDSGVLMVKHGETSTTFRSLSEMNLIIAELEGRINELSSTTVRRTYGAYQSGKGL